MKSSSYLSTGDAFSGFQKSLSKKSEYFFSELEVTLTSVDVGKQILSGVIDKKVISVAGKKQSLRVFFEGEIIDGLEHTFTSELSSNCEALDVYFWSRFPAFKDIEGGLKGLKEHSARYVYMRWHEKGTLKTKRRLPDHSEDP